MAVAEYLIIISDDFNGTGDNVNASLLNSYEAVDEPAYLPNGEARYIIRFHLAHSHLPIEWSFPSSSDRDSELALVNTAIAEQLSSD